MRHLHHAKQKKEPGESAPCSQPRFDRVTVVLLLLWGAASFGVTWFARDLRQVVAGWPVNFWFVAQGAVLTFLGIVVAYAAIRNRQDRANAHSRAQTGKTHESA